MNQDEGSYTLGHTIDSHKSEFCQNDCKNRACFRVYAFSTYPTLSSKDSGCLQK